MSIARGKQRWTCGGDDDDSDAGSKGNTSNDLGGGGDPKRLVISNWPLYIDPTEKGVKGTVWAAYNAVSEYADHGKTWIGKTDEAKANTQLNSIWFGGSAELNGLEPSSSSRPSFSPSPSVYHLRGLVCERLTS